MQPDYMQMARRATTGRSVLGWVALVCLILNGAWWGTLMLDLLRPPSPLSPQAIQAALSIAAFALVLPLCWSSLLPNSPAMRLLQRQSWHLPGQMAITAAAVFLTWFAGYWTWIWWGAQPTIKESGNALFLTISSLIAGTLVPALSWAAMTPEQWIAQIEQARQVKRLEHALKMEEAAMRATYARAVALLNAGLCNLTIEQRQELGGILGGFARVQQQALIAIGQSWRDMYGVEQLSGGMPDQQIVEQYRKVVNLLGEGSEAMEETAIRATLPALGDRAGEETREYIARSNDRHQYATEPARRAPTARPGGPAHRPTSGPVVGRPVSDRASERAHAEAYDTAYRALGSNAWRRAELEEALKVSKTQALTYIQAWLAGRDITKLDEPRDHYVFAEVN